VGTVIESFPEPLSPELPASEAPASTLLSSAATASTSAGAPIASVSLSTQAANEKPHTVVAPEVPTSSPGKGALTTALPVAAAPHADAPPASPVLPSPVSPPLEAARPAAVPSPTPMPINTTLIRNSILEEILRSRGLDPNGWVREVVEPLVMRSIDRFVQMMAEVDRRTAATSFREAAAWLLPQYARGVEVIGLDQVPTDGPVLFVSNHPGNFDEVVIAANVERADLRIFANGHPVLTSFPAISRHAVYSKDNDPAARMNALRTGIRNLRQGSSLLIFPTGRTDPDPRCSAGASEAIDNWSPSVELIVNRAPETQVVVTLVSGVTSRPILNNPLLRLRRQQVERQKLAGSIQMALQLLFPRLFHLVPRVSFSQPLTLRDLTQDGSKSVQQAIIDQAKGLLHLHTVDQPIVPPVALQPAG
jgi:hypothetical protein